MQYAWRRCGCIGLMFAPAILSAQTAELDRGKQSEWFYTQRAGNSGIPAGAYAGALQQRQAMPIGTGAAAGPWLSLGPAPIANGYQGFPTSGRVSAIAVDPNNPNTVYVGGAQGGVWQSLDGGNTWTPLTDTQPSLATGSITIDPTNSNVIYVGTGEPNVSCDSYYGMGILKSTDAGASWIQLGATVFRGTTVHKVLVNPANPNVVYATRFWEARPQLPSPACLSRRGIRR